MNPRTPGDASDAERTHTRELAARLVAPSLLRVESAGLATDITLSRPGRFFDVVDAGGSLPVEVVQAYCHATDRKHFTLGVQARRSGLEG